MSVSAALYREVRVAERHAVALDGTLRNPAWEPFDVVVEDLSLTGFRIPAGADLTFRDFVSLGLPGVGVCPATVIWTAGERCGCEFLVPLSPNQLVAALRGSIIEPAGIGTASASSLPTSDGRPRRGFSGIASLAIIFGVTAAAWASGVGAIEWFKAG